MKATRSSGSIVCFDVPEEKYKTLESICRPLGLRIRQVPKNEFDKCIAEQFHIMLPAGLGAPQEGVDYDFPEELMIIHITEESLFNKFLQESRAQNAVIDYKAVMTPTNSMWHPKQLRDELAKEHEYMKKMGQKSADTE